MKSKYYRIFFISFYFLAVFVCLNVIIAFMIDYIVSQWKNFEYRNQKTLKRKIETIRTKFKKKEKNEEEIENFQLFLDEAIDENQNTIIHNKDV